MKYDVEIERLPTFAVFDLRGKCADLVAWTGYEFEESPGRFLKGGFYKSCHVGPDNWLIIANISKEKEISNAFRSNETPAQISIVKLSDAYTFFSVNGNDFENVVSIGCPLDLHTSSFPSDAARFSEFFGIRALFIRDQHGILIAVEQSYGNFIEDYLTRATA